jgi:hypothetical protein
VGAIASGILAEKTGKMEQIAKAGETLKGQCHEMAIFVEGLNILIRFALMIFKAFQKLITMYTILTITILFTFLKLVTNSGNAY